MHDIFMDLSFSFLMDLYRAKIKAENKNDSSAIKSLKQHYPELFTEEFQYFIDKTKAAAKKLDYTYHENFYEIFEIPHDDINDKKH